MNHASNQKSKRQSRLSRSLVVDRQGSKTTTKIHIYQIPLHLNIAQKVRLQMNQLAQKIGSFWFIGPPRPENRGFALPQENYQNLRSTAGQSWFQSIEIWKAITRNDPNYPNHILGINALFCPALLRGQQGPPCASLIDTAPHPPPKMSACRSDSVAVLLTVLSLDSRLRALVMTPPSQSMQESCWCISSLITKCQWVSPQEWFCPQKQIAGIHYLFLGTFFFIKF